MEGTRGSQALSDFVIEFAKVLGSKLKTEPDTAKRPAVLYYIQGTVGEFDFSGDEPVLNMDDEAGEYDEESDVFGALGVIARPLEPEVYNSRNYYAEVVCVRTADGLVPISIRDLRLQMPGNAPHDGTIALVGYGGGFLSFDPVDKTKPTASYDGTIAVLYCPYDFDSQGVAQKAHSIILDPTPGNESVSIVHGTGSALTIADTGEVLLKSPNGNAYISITDAGIQIAGQINLVGGVVIGNPSFAVPLLAGPASPPCSTLFLSP